MSRKTHDNENIIENKITLTSKKIDIPAKVALVDVLTWLTFPIDLYLFAISTTLSGLVFYELVNNCAVTVSVNDERDFWCNRHFEFSCVVLLTHISA